MATCTTNKIDSNIVGLSYSEEECLGLLPTAPVWTPMEPNSFADFGGSVTTVARNPLNPSRQRKKGVITDLDASGGFNTDITQENLQDLLQGFLFADARSKGEWPVSAVDGTDGYTVTAQGATAAAVSAGGSGYAVGDVLVVQDGTTGVGSPTRLRVTTVGAAGAVTAVVVAQAGSWSTNPTNPVGVNSESGSGRGATFTLTLAAGAGLGAGDLLFGRGFTNTQNNGFRVVTAVVAGEVVAGTMVDEVPNANARLFRVGHQFDADDLEVSAVPGGFPQITSAAVDFRTLGIIPGEWIHIGGDAPGTAFTEAENNGFKRVRAVNEKSLVLDKSDQDMTSENGVGLTVQVFLGKVIKNESARSLIKRRSYQLERTLGSLDGLDPPQSEYLIGAVANELVLNLSTAAIATADVSFVGIDMEQRTQAQGLKAGTRVPLVESDAYNTTSDFVRIKLAEVVDGESAPDPLFAYASEMTLTVNNNVTPNKAIGVLGAFDTTAGTFAVSGSITAYFASILATRAVRNNADITLDYVAVKDNAGFAIDVPLIALGDGRATVEVDQPIMLPLTSEAATGAKIDPALDYTLLFAFFPYLPNLAG